MVRASPVESAESEQVGGATARVAWQERHGAPRTGVAAAPATTATQGAAEWVEVGHKRRMRREGFEQVDVQRGGGRVLGNPFHMRYDGRGTLARAERTLREAVCAAYGELLQREPTAAAVREVASQFGGLAFDADLATEAAAQARRAEVERLAGRVRSGGRVQLMCTCAPLQCHGGELARWIVERAGVGRGACGEQQVDAGWRPEGGAAGLFWDQGDWELMRAWTREAGAAWERMAAGEAPSPPPDLHIPAHRLRPEARALAPWATGGEWEAAPVPVAQVQQGPPECGLRAAFFHAQAHRGDEDSEICHELPWGFELDGTTEDIFLAFHHASCYPQEGSESFSAAEWRQAAMGVVDVEGPEGQGWLQAMGTVPFVPMRAVPRGIADQVHKLRVVTDHTYPFGGGVSTNECVGLEHLPDIKLSSGVRYAHMVAVMRASGAPVLMWKRDAVSAYRQVPMAPCEWWKCGTVGPGGLLVDTRLSFGSRVAPNKFQRLMMVALREVMRRIHAFDEAHPPTAPGLRAWLTERRAAVGDGRMAAAVQYIDDTCAVSVHDLVEATGRRRGHHHAEIFDEVMVEAGVEMAEGKKREESEVEMEALGVVVSVAEECVYYPEGKRLRVERIIDGMLAAAAEGRMVERRQVESLMGKLKWVAHVAPTLAPRLASGFAMARAKGRPALVRPSARFVADMTAVRGELGSLPRIPLAPRSDFPPIHTQASVLGFQDASGSWGIGGFFVAGTTLFFFQEEYPTDVRRALERREITIATTELAAEMALVAAVAARRRNGEVRAEYVTDFTDNEAARAAAQRGTASSATMAPLAEELARMVAAEGLALRTARVTTHENKLTDGLSRASRAQLEWAAGDAGLVAMEVAVEARVWGAVRECMPRGEGGVDGE